MQFRGMLAALVLLIVLGAGVWYTNKTNEEKEKKGSPDTPKILTVPDDQISQLEIRRKDGKNTTIRKTDKWQITAPETLPADQEAIGAVATTIASLQAERIVEENATDLAGFGLNAPQVELVVTKKDGKTAKLSIGDETATGNGFFARIEGDPKVYTVTSVNKTSIDKTTLDLRDKRLVTFDPEKLSRVEIAAKGAPVELGKNAQNEWQIVKPKPLRADNWGIEEIVRKIKDAKMDPATTEEDAKTAASNFASGTKIATVKLTDAAGSHEIEVRKKENDYFAKGSAVAGFHKVTVELGEGVNKGLDELRNRKVFDFGFNDPSRLEIKGPDGQTKVYEKTGEKWKLGNQEMDSVSVQSFVDKLRDLAATKFVDSGFTTAAFEVKLTAKEGKLIDHVQISRAANGSTFGVRVGEPSVYEFTNTTIDELKAAADAIKPPAPPAPAGKKDEKKK